MIVRNSAICAGQYPERSSAQGLSASMIIAAVVFAAYSVVLSSSFGVMDDYTFLHNAMVGSKHTLNLQIAAGRPLNALLLDLGFSSTGTIESLSILRAITLVGIWLLGCGVYYFARVHSVGFISSLAMACGIVLLPSFQVYASWAQHFTTPFAGAIALSSAFILTPACTVRERSRLLAVSVSILLLLTAILLYQPIAMLFCTGILISIVARPDMRIDWSGGRVIDAVIVFITAMLLGFVAFKICQHYRPDGSLRYGLVQNIPEKLGWFVSEPVANALSLFSVPANGTSGSAVIVALLLGGFLFVRKHSSKIGLMILIAGGFCLLGSYAPNLATAENWASYRSIGALGASLVVLLVLMVSEIYDHIRRRYPSNGLVGRSSVYHWVAPTILLIVLTIQAQSNVLKGFVLPNVTELNNLASALNDGKIQKSEKVTVIVRPSSWSDSAARPLAYDEFGMPSSAKDYYARSMVEIVVRSTNYLPNAMVALDADAIANRQLVQCRSLVVDFPRLVTSQRFKTAPSASLHFSPSPIVPLNISDDNWKNGIWASRINPGAYSFVYRTNCRDRQLRAGDKLKFYRSGIRVVLRIDFAGDYINVLVDGAPLHPEDGYPRSIMQDFDIH